MWYATNLSIFKTGLAFVLLGAGFFSPSSNNLIRALYEKYPEHKESAFVVTTVAGNISGALAPLLYGLFGANGDWHYAFGLSALFNLLALNVILNKRHSFFENCHFNFRETKFTLKQLLVPVSLLVVSIILLQHLNWLSDLFYLSCPFALFATIFIARLPKNERQNTVFLLLLTSILMVFYIFVFQIYSSITSFVAHSVNRKLFNLNIPASAYAALQCIFFIIFAPIVNKLCAKRNQQNLVSWPLQKIIIGLLIATGGFFVFGISESIAVQQGICSSWWIVFANMLLGLGEVFLYPPILVMIATFSPKPWAGVYMGGFSLSIAIASFLAGKLATCIAQARSLSSYATVLCATSFAKISFALLLLALIAAMCFWLISPWLTKRRQTI